MPILTLQRRLREAGRIRIGQQVATSNGKTRPAKLDAFRLTSTDRNAIDAAAQLYGGDPHPWEGGPAGTWEVFTTANLLPVVVPPAATAFSQWMENWSGGGCVRRCDGDRMMSLDGKATDEPCLCSAEDDPPCKPTTRLNVILRELPGLGVWRLESHGFYAASELAGTVEVCMAAATRGQLLPAVLRLEQREVKRPGEATRKFGVPILDVQMRPEALGLVVGSGPAAGELDGGGRSWQPLSPPPAAELGAGSVSQAIRETRAEPGKRRKNSPPELPPTGLTPRGMNPPADVPPVAPSSTDGSGPTQAQLRMVHALMRGQGIDSDDDRHNCASATVGHPVASLNDLTRDEMSKLIDSLKGNA